MIVYVVHKQLTRTFDTFFTDVVVSYDNHLIRFFEKHRNMLQHRVGRTPY